MASKKPKNNDRASSSLPSFGRMLRAARELAGFVTAAEFAKALGIEPETYRRYERGETDPSLANLVAIHKRTGQSYERLLGGPDIIPVLRTEPIGIAEARTPNKDRTKRSP